MRRRVPVNPGRRAGDAARERAAGRAVGRAAGDLPPRLPPEASVGSRLTRRCDPARGPRPRTRRFTSCPGPSRCLKSRQRRHGLEALPPNGSPQGFWPLLAYGAPPPEIDAECAPRSLASVLRAPQPSPPPHAPIPHPLAAQRHPHASLARLAATLPCAVAQVLRVAL